MEIIFKGLIPVTGTNGKIFLIKVAGKYAEGVYATGPKDVSKNTLTVKDRKDHQKD